MIYPPILGVSEFVHIQKHKDLVLLDASGGPNARARYNQEHLAGAHFVDLNSQLAAIKDDFAQGGRHPLPTPNQFSKTLGQLGITRKSHIILYDNLNGANAAARFWWMLRAFGHESVQVLDGGLAAAKKAELTMSTERFEIKSAPPYPQTKWQLPTVNLSEVDKATLDPEKLIIDVREEGRFTGTFEPIDLVAGHIPNAINAPFKNNLDVNGQFLAPDQLKSYFEEMADGRTRKDIIVHCGSGVTACHTLLAMSYAGLEIPSLYVGSWSEWSRNGKEMVFAARE